MKRKTDLPEPASAAIVPHEAVPSQALTYLEAPAGQVLAEAKTAATALQDVIRSKPNKVVMKQGDREEQYLEFEDWQTLGKFYGITAGEESEPEYVQFSERNVEGFKATAVAYSRDGRILSRATAYCLTDEEKWRSRIKYGYAYELRSGGQSMEDPGPDEIVWIPNPKKPGKKMPKRTRVPVDNEPVPLFQLSSMAQTRANAKVLRNVLSWVAVLAGYKPTPAEELDWMAHEEPNGAVDAEMILPQPPPPPPPTPAAVPPVMPGNANPVVPAPPQSAPPAPTPATPPPSGGVPACPQCGKTVPVMKSKYKAGTYYCNPKGRQQQGCGANFRTAGPVATDPDEVGAEREGY